jgi:hypothetical protein
MRRIEMHLASRVSQKAKVCGHTIEFRRGETIHTENSYKYTPERFQCLAAGAGWHGRDVDGCGQVFLRARADPRLIRPCFSSLHVAGQTKTAGRLRHISSVESPIGGK